MKSWQIGRGQAPLVQPTEPRKRGIYEREIGWFVVTEKENHPAILKEIAPRIHAEFMKRIREGWEIAV